MNKNCIYILIIFSLIINIFTSCEKEKHRASFQIINKLDCDIIIKLYANQNYSKYDMYKASRDGGGYMLNIQRFQPNKHGYTDIGMIASIFDTDEWAKLPSEVLSAVFDSIKITICKGDSLKLFFSKERLQNYNYNLLIDNSSWFHKTQIIDFPTMFNKNETKYEQYYFDIDSTKIK